MAAGGGVDGLPSGSSLSPTLRALLNHQFKSIGDLANAPSLLTSLSSDLHVSKQRLSDLHSSIAATLAAWASLSHSTSCSLTFLSRKLNDFSPEAPLAPTLGSAAQEEFIGQLPLLAAEVARVERVRLYAETTLRLEALVGDLEDAVASIVVGGSQIQLPRKMANSPAKDVLIDLSSKFSSAANVVQKVEDVVVEMTASWPQWKRLVMAVDIRVDRALASLKPAALADYRSKLQIIGWPPPLSAGSQEGEESNTKLDNPLLKLQGEMKRRFEESFASLSILQALLCSRRARQGVKGSQTSLKIVGEAHDHELLWTLDELVTPIKSRATHHFLKWSEKPDLIFGLAYRLAQQHTDIVDMVLQPMLDRVKLAGYCVREEWISAVVTMVMNHLRAHTLAELSAKLLDDGHDEEAASLWLHIVDLTILFDRRMRSIALQSVVSSTSKVEYDSFEESVNEFHPIVRCLSAFAERKEWLELWSNLEVGDAQEKLSDELQKESVWLVGSQLGVAGSTVPLQSDSLLEDYHHPPAAEIAMLKMWALINRCRSLPQRSWQLVYVLHVGAPYMSAFLARMLQKCQEAEAMTALAEDNAVSVVVSCVNAACFCEHKLQEWSEDIFFLDLRRLQVLSAIGESDVSSLGLAESEDRLSPVQGCVFDREISSLMQFRHEWLQKLVSATQRALDASCQDYQRNKKRWQEDNQATGLVGELFVSSSLVDGLAILQRRLSMLKVSLGDAAFVDFWRSLASSLDQFFLNAVALGGAKFSSFGSAQLAKDIEALCQIFKPFCVRPAKFFPNLSDVALLLALPQEDSQQLQKALAPSSNWRFRDQGDESKLTSLRLYGIRGVSPATAGRVLAQRVFSKV
ncbi:hypothetical protein GOP47_0000539 [Adiantum capillus-veneris]|uniref:Uncharacterized protein n=1 Tax=Adiantum capillus-veneris TaxID=13818 RepID=A0A9D4ZT64_ADICA|nr:hypothetical protein GOP47_0000539 [Adiantum capillus-veneris]